MENRSRPSSKLVVHPSFHIEADYGPFGELMLAESAQWLPANAVHGEGYLLREVSLPEKIDQLESVSVGDRLVLMTSRDQPWVEPGCCFVATTVNTEILQTNQTRNPFLKQRAVDSSTSQSSGSQQHIHSCSAS